MTAQLAGSFTEFLTEQGYLNVRRLPTGEWAGVQMFLFTWGLMVGLDNYGYRTRFCYEHPRDALAALEAWDGIGDPPGPWIKEKGRGGERDGPGARHD